MRPLSAGDATHELRSGAREAAVQGGPELVLLRTLVPEKLLLTVRLCGCARVIFKDRECFGGLKRRKGFPLNCGSRFPVPRRSWETDITNFSLTHLCVICLNTVHLHYFCNMRKQMNEQ